MYANSNEIVADMAQLKQFRIYFSREIRLMHSNLCTSDWSEPKYIASLNRQATFLGENKF
jgi:hypothetical protein